MSLVKKEIENHIKKYNVEYIYFWADTFLAWDQEEFDQFIEMYSKIKLPFWCQTRIETIDKRKFSQLKDISFLFSVDASLTIIIENSNFESDISELILYISLYNDFQSLNMGIKIIIFFM